QLLHGIVEFTGVNESVMRTTRKETTKNKIKKGKGVTSKAKETCYKCGEKGHYKSECKNKKVKCVKSGTVMFIDSQINNQKVLVSVANNTKADIELVGSVKKHLITKVDEVDSSVPREISLENIHVDVSTTPEIVNKLVHLYLVKMDIRDNNVPVIFKPCQASLKKTRYHSRNREWTENGNVTETQSQYASPVLLVSKKTGKPRLVVNYRAPRSKREDIINHTGRNAAYEFCRLMNTALGPLNNKICVCYLDDLLLDRNVE
ncbi:hypothetical protein ILUMI_17862, partial [Ignelater luminosus]